uniref:DH domain-containing protein n=1 Tax=Stegastes partitus TaxID=144197 RepID=A0A3B4ZFU1_9TELE
MFGCSASQATLRGDPKEDDGHLENGIHAAKDSDRQHRLRLCVLNEIVNTERDYVRTLLFLQSVSFDVTPQLSFSLLGGTSLPNSTHKSFNSSCSFILTSLLVV